VILLENESVGGRILRLYPWREPPSIDLDRSKGYRCVNIQKFMVGWLGGSIVALWAIFAPSSAWAQGVTAAQPVALFEVHCAGCHLNGGNIVRRGKTLQLKALQKNSVDSVGAIAALIANGKNNMPAYRSKLTAPQIDALAHYVLDRAKKGWPKA
jgi:cytochrome c6